MKGGGNSSIGYSRDLSGSSGSKPSDDCNIDVKTDLKSVQPSLTKYSVGDALIVQLDAANRIIATGEHGLCGIIIPLNVIQLRNCIIQGKEYIAIIIDLGASHCEVRVKPKI